jgi:hypothetical protein
MLKTESPQRSNPLLVFTDRADLIARISVDLLYQREAAVILNGTSAVALQK